MFFLFFLNTRRTTERSQHLHQYTNMWLLCINTHNIFHTTIEKKILIFIYFYRIPFGRRSSLIWQFFSFRSDWLSVSFLISSLHHKKVILNNINAIARFASQSNNNPSLGSEWKLNKKQLMNPSTPRPSPRGLWGVSDVRAIHTGHISISKPAATASS